jgi:hypothetical protein
MTDKAETRILIATIALIVILAWARFPWEAFAPAFPMPR